MEKFEFEGLDDVMKALENLPEKITVGLLASVHRKALMEHIVKPLRTALPYTAETKRGIIAINDRKDRANATVWGGVSSDSYWVRFAEKGTKERTAKKTHVTQIDGKFVTIKEGTKLGKVTGNKKVEQVINNQIGDVVEFVNTQYGEEINNFLEKRIKKLKK
jgi:hypothetical protein